MNVRNHRTRIAARLLAVALTVTLLPSITAAQEQEPERPQHFYSYSTSGLPSFTAQEILVSGIREGGQLPQDIRIMQRIVSTALGEVDAPELPEELRSDEATGTTVLSSGDNVYTLAFPGGGRSFSIGSRDVTGFYMEGYGYLFTVKWQVRPRGNFFLSGDAGAVRVAELNALVAGARRAAAASDDTEARAASEAEQTLEEEREALEAQQAAWEAWASDYRDILASELQQVVAGYGATLKRAAADESITFIADFGGGDDETVTVSTQYGALSNTDREANLSAVDISYGSTGISEMLDTELKIMAEIIDSYVSNNDDNSAWVVRSGDLHYYGGDSSYQHVPGYGVLFRKPARLNLATRVIQRTAPGRTNVTVGTLREQIDETTEEQRETYSEHLTRLKETTAEVLSTYGPTLTGLDGDAWVGVYYDVGSAAGLLEGGISNFLVQARMADIRNADAQGGAGWLLDRLVTNEKDD